MKKITFIFSALLVFGLVIGAYALSRTTSAKTEDCCKQSCPMKSKEKNASAGKHSCCGDSCCKDGQCPMKNKDAAGTEKTSAGCPCCGDSCPMMKSKEKTSSSAATGDVTLGHSH